MPSFSDHKPERELRHAVERSLSALRASQEPQTETLRLIIGVSGGEDSHALLHVLAGLRERHDLELTVCHVDHGLRPESAEEAQFVRALAESYKAGFRLETPGPRENRENVEAWGRAVRYSFFERVRQELSAHAILTAHHQNDQAETILFRFLTARLLTSAKSISEYDSKLKILRPLLAVSKTQIANYIRLHGLSFVSDSSNLDQSRARNRIRLDLLPMLVEQYNPNLVEDLSLLARRLGEDERFLREQAHSFASRAGDMISIKFLEAEVPEALKWRVLAVRAEEQLGEDAGRIGFHAFRAVLQVMERRDLDGPKTVELGFGYVARIHPVKGVDFRSLG